MFFRYWWLSHIGYKYLIWKLNQVFHEILKISLHGTEAVQLAVPLWNCVSTDYSTRGRVGAATVRKRGWLPSSRAVGVCRWPRRLVALHSVDGGNSTRDARSPSHGSPDRPLDRPTHRHGGRRRHHCALCGHRLRPRRQYDLHQNQRQL